MIIFDKKTDRKIGVFGLSVVFITFIGMILVNSRTTEKRAEQYPRILNKDEVSVVITKVKKMKGTSFIDYDNGSFRVSPSRNHLYKYCYFDENVYIGDSLYKRAYSDTIYVFSKTRGELYFVHGEYINED